MTLKYWNILARFMTARGVFIPYHLLYGRSTHRHPCIRGLCTMISTLFIYALPLNINLLNERYTVYLHIDESQPLDRNINAQLNIYVRRFTNSHWRPWLNHITNNWRNFIDDQITLVVLPKLFQVSFSTSKPNIVATIHVFTNVFFLYLLFGQFICLLNWSLVDFRPAVLKLYYWYLDLGLTTNDSRTKSPTYHMNESNDGGLNRVLKNTTDVMRTLNDARYGQSNVFKNCGYRKLAD